MYFSSSMVLPLFGMRKKRGLILTQHYGVTFEQATQAFFDPMLVVVDASRNDESRDAIIGLDERWNCLYVVYIELENDMIRIISARKATRKEREFYEN